MATQPIVVEDLSEAIVVESTTDYIALEGGGPVITGMPDCIGQLLWDALDLLQKAGVLVPASIGYFGLYPISVKWIPATVNRGVVVAQSIIQGVNVIPNTPILLTVNDFPMSVIFP